jgi:putative ABC transport system permease protein
MGSVLLAVREMRRAKVRFGLLASAVGVLVFLIVFQQALLSGLVTEFVGAIRNQSADVLVYGADARLNLQGSVIVGDAPARIAAVDGVAAAEPLGVATVTVDAGGERRDATLFGHTLAGPGRPVTLADGRRPERDREAVASAGAAGDGFAVGDTVVVQPGGLEIEIVGSARQTSFSVTPTLFASYATYEAVRLAANPDAPAVVPSAVAVAVDEGADADEVATAITATVDGVEAVSRARAADEAPGVEAVSQSFGVILLLTYVVVTIVVGFFFLILTVQKRASLTVLRAVGAPAGRLVGGLAVQVAAVLVGGLVLGTLLATLALRSSGSGIEARVEPGALAGTSVVLVILAAVACIGAARRIVRLDPVAATQPGAEMR